MHFDKAVFFFLETVTNHSVLLRYPPDSLTILLKAMYFDKTDCRNSYNWISDLIFTQLVKYTSEDNVLYQTRHWKRLRLDFQIDIHVTTVENT